MGAFFSLMALGTTPPLSSPNFHTLIPEPVAQNTFDVLGGVLYILCIFIEGGIFISHLIWRFRTRKIRAKANEEGKTFDDVAEECRREGIGFRWAEREVRLPFFRSKPEGPGELEAGDAQGESTLKVLEVNLVLELKQSLRTSSWTFFLCKNTC